MFEKEIEKINSLRSVPKKKKSFEPVSKRAYTVDDIMKILSISRDGAYELIKKNYFHSVRIGGRIRISCQSFEEWLNGKEGQNGDK